MIWIRKIFNEHVSRKSLLISVYVAEGNHTASCYQYGHATIFFSSSTNFYVSSLGIANEKMVIGNESKLHDGWMIPRKHSYVACCNHGESIQTKNQSSNTMRLFQISHAFWRSKCSMLRDNQFNNNRK